MHAWALSRAVVTCQGRRFATVALGHRVTAAAVAAGTVAAMVALAIGASVLAAELGPALEDREIARALVIGLALPSIAAGAALAISTRGVLALGAQIAAGPITRVAAAVAVDAAPAALAGLLACPVALAALLPLSLAAPGGTVAGIACALFVVSAVCCGGLAGEACLSAWRRSGVARGGLAVAVAVLGAGATLPPGMPLEGTAAALAGDRGALLPCLSSFALAVVAAAGWVVLASVRPEPRGGRGRRSFLIPSGSSLASAWCAGLALSRRDDLRAAAAAGVALAAGAAIFSRATAAPAPSATVLAAAAATIATAPVALAVTGSISDARALWVSAPVARVAVAAAWAVASLAATTVVVCVAIAPAVLVERPAIDALGTVAALAGLGWTAALAAGAIVPWRRSGAGDQALSLAAFVLVSALCSVSAGLVGPRLVEIGVPSGVAVVLLVSIAIGTASSLVVRVLGPR